MELLDEANTGAFGDAGAGEGAPDHRKGPFIVISGHDLSTCKRLLEQTAGKGINVYTHCEMLPAHGYPELKAFPTSRAISARPGRTSRRSCGHPRARAVHHQLHHAPARQLRRPGVHHLGGGYPGVPHIGEGRGLFAGHRKGAGAGRLRGGHPAPGMNGGTTVTTGFARAAVLQHADEIVQAVKTAAPALLSGRRLRRRPPRPPLLHRVCQAPPPDTMLLTLACGKFRLNDLPLGTVPGPAPHPGRGPVQRRLQRHPIALALADAFGCGVNDLPLSMVLSWYEQKAVCILLTLLALGIRDIRLGPPCPRSSRPGVVRTLQERYGLKPIATPGSRPAGHSGRVRFRLVILQQTRKSKHSS